LCYAIPGTSARRDDAVVICPGYRKNEVLVRRGGRRRGLDVGCRDAADVGGESFDPFGKRALSPGGAREAALDEFEAGLLAPGGEDDHAGRQRGIKPSGAGPRCWRGRPVKRVARRRAPCHGDEGEVSAPGPLPRDSVACGAGVTG